MDKDKEQQARRADILRRIQGLRLMDDNFMTRVLENRDCAQLVLRLVLDRPDLEVVESRTQYAIKNLQGRSVQLDIFARDAEGKKINVEIQRDDRGVGQTGPVSCQPDRRQHVGTGREPGKFVGHLCDFHYGT